MVPRSRSARSRRRAARAGVILPPQPPASGAERIRADASRDRHEQAGRLGEADSVLPQYPRRGRRSSPAAGI